MTVKKTRFSPSIITPRRRGQWKTLAARHRSTFTSTNTSTASGCSCVFGHFTRVRREQNTATMRDGTQIKPPPPPVVGALRFPWQFAGIYKSTDAIRRPAALFPRARPPPPCNTTPNHHPRQPRKRSPTPRVLIK